MDEELISHRKNVSHYIDQCLYNYSRWIKTGPKTKSYLLNRYCSTINEVSWDYQGHLHRFINNNKGYLQHQPAIQTGIKPKVIIKPAIIEKPIVKNKEVNKVSSTRYSKIRMIKPVRKFNILCGQELTKTLTYLVAETDYKDEGEVAEALLTNPKFKQFLVEYANDFYLDLLEDEIIT